MNTAPFQNSAHHGAQACNIRTFADAVQLLQGGQVLIYPTETFLAVGCAMHAEKALDEVFASKRRPVAKPLPLLASSVEQVQRIAQLAQGEKKLAHDFWPGPLTVLCQAREMVPPSITAGTGRVAVRISPHATALALADALGEPLVCSSANISGEAPPRVPQEISADLAARVPYVLWHEDMPEPCGGLPSTIVQVCGEKALCIRRHGAVSAEQLMAKGWQIMEMA